MPRKIRQLVNDLTKAGFREIPGGKGSHRKFIHEKVPGATILSGQDGADAKRYQENEVAKKIEAAKAVEQTEETKEKEVK